MPSDALFQSGMVSVAADASREEDRLRRAARRVRVAACGGAAARAAAHRRAASRRARLHPMQDQVCRSRTPA